MGSRIGRAGCVGFTIPSRYRAQLASGRTSQYKYDDVAYQRYRYQHVGTDFKPGSMSYLGVFCVVLIVFSGAFFVHFIVLILAELSVFMVKTIQTF